MVPIPAVMRFSVSSYVPFVSVTTPVGDYEGHIGHVGQIFDRNGLLACGGNCELQRRPPGWLCGGLCRRFGCSVGRAFYRSLRRSVPPWHLAGGPAILPPAHPQMARLQTAALPPGQKWVGAAFVCSRCTPWMCVMFVYSHLAERWLLCSGSAPAHRWHTGTDRHYGKTGAKHKILLLHVLGHTPLQPAHHQRQEERHRQIQEGHHIIRLKIHKRAYRIRVAQPRNIRHAQHRDQR